MVSRKETPVPVRAFMSRGSNGVEFIAIKHAIFVSLFVVRDEVFFAGIDDKDGQQAGG
jgi:hypothetical protein